MITAAYTGRERVMLDGETHTGPNAEGDLARSLIGQGVDPATQLVFSRNGTPCLRGSVAAFAGRAWAGNGADPQFRRWEPHPQGQYAPLLMQWAAQRPPPKPRGKPGRPARGEAPSAPGRQKNRLPPAWPETRASLIATNQASPPL